MPVVTSLRVYPVKGCKAICVNDVAVLETGFGFDRHWLCVTADSGRFYSQRNEAKLALVEQALYPPELLSSQCGQLPADAALVLNAPGMSTLKVPLAVAEKPGMEQRQVICWEWKGIARDEGNEAAAWFSAVLGKPTRLVRFLGRPGTNDAAADPERKRRAAMPAGWGRVPGHEVAFSDRLPYLLTSEASLAKLNELLGEESVVPMERFRPNVVVDSAGSPFAEDAWEAFAVKGPDHAPCKFNTVLPCDRCKVTTTDQKTLKVGKEPLQALSTFRALQHLDFIPKEKFPSGAVFFGWLCVSLGRGSIKVGDEVVPQLRDGPLL